MNKIGIDKFHIELIENYPCNSNDEICKREGYWIRKLKTTLNTNIAGRDNYEYRQDNAEKIKEQKHTHYVENSDTILKKQKKYYEENKSTVLEKQKKYYETNKDIINQRNKQYHNEHKESIAEQGKHYRELNKEKIKERDKLYRDSHKQQIKEVLNKYIDCECGEKVKRTSYYRHIKTNRHTDKINGTYCESSSNIIQCSCGYNLKAENINRHYKRHLESEIHQKYQRFGDLDLINI